MLVDRNLRAGFVFALALFGCSGSGQTHNAGLSTGGTAGASSVGGAVGTGGASSGGSASGGTSASGGSASGGDSSSGGSVSGGASSTGGSASGGAASGGDSSGGGAASGGATSSGGSAAGGAAAGGSGGLGTGGSGGVAGGAGSLGSGGSAGGPQQQATSLDLLFAVDNSISTSDKQQLLQTTIPEFMNRLVNPLCIDAGGVPVQSQPLSPQAPCPVNSQREFPPIRDMHIGVITSSLGAHGGGQVCLEADKNDFAHLIPFVRTGVPSYDGRGFLKWDPDGTANPPGENDVVALADALDVTLQSVGDTGCGYEAQLESIYRFLVDPEPPLNVTVQNGLSTVDGLDTELLAERAEFLRPGSSVVVVMLTDENDCSIRDDGQGWLVGTSTLNATAFYMPRATAICAVDPNSPCCRSCATAEGAPPTGCGTLASDPECMLGPRTAGSDTLNLRCYNQKRRFGFELLYPTSRYIDGLTSPVVQNRAGTPVANPLFVGRDPSLFTLAVIAGVPWQDIVTPASLAGANLTYLTAAQLEAQNRWALIIGNPETFVNPLDPFMIESPDPRSGMNPVTSDSIASASSLNPRENAINGHEYNNTDNTDLQYACISELAEPLICPAEPAVTNCDCFATDIPRNRPICQPPTGGAANTTQYYFKAYPALRELAVARGLGDRAVVSSICARNTSDATRTDYGYRPAFAALARRLVDTLQP